jgi:hypothetical protein
MLVLGAGEMGTLLPWAAHALKATSGLAAVLLAQVAPAGYLYCRG